MGNQLAAPQRLQPEILSELPNVVLKDSLGETGWHSALQRPLPPTRLYRKLAACGCAPPATRITPHHVVGSTATFHHRALNHVYPLHSTDKAAGG